MIALIVLTKLSRQFDKRLVVEMGSKSDASEIFEVLIMVYIAKSVGNPILITQVNSDDLGIVGMKCSYDFISSLLSISPHQRRG